MEETRRPDRADARRRAETRRERLEWRQLFRLRSNEEATQWIRERSGPAVGDGSDPAQELALEAWGAAREELERSEIGLRARTIEIGLIQALGQRAAEASGVRDLFARAADVLGTAGPLQVALAVHRIHGRTEAEAFLGVPASDDALRTIARRAERFLDWKPVERLEVETRRTGAFDDAHGTLTSVREQDTTFLPLRRGSRTEACLALVHAAPPDESLTRVLWSAANQLSLHLDRILTVREAEQDRFRSILDSMSPAVVLTDAGLRVRHANRAARNLLHSLGLAADEARLGGVEALDLEPLARRVLDGGDAKVEDERRLGSDRLVHVSMSAFRSPEGGADGLVVVVTDVTDARRMQDQLAQAEKLSSLGEMISGVAHELNNPLASVLGYAQLMQATVQDESLRSKLEVLDRESRRCQKIVQNLLRFARRHEPERRAVSVNEIVESVGALMRYQLKVDGIALETALHPGLPAVHADPHLLQQVLINLLTNAHHAMRDADRQGAVRITTTPVGDDRVRCVVEDDGPGIPPELRSRVFDPFFTTKESGRGTGLGLALVYANVTAHDGEVVLRESASGGACFVLELPVGAAPSAQANGRGEHDPPPVATPCRILVVEDETAVGEFLREALAEDGHDVTLVGDGAAAMAVAGEAFDVALIDWRIPAISGRRLFERLERDHPELLARAILTTGDTVSREVDAFAEAHRLPLLHKPFDLRDLRRAIRARIRGARQA